MIRAARDVEESRAGHEPFVSDGNHGSGGSLNSSQNESLAQTLHPFFGWPDASPCGGSDGRVIWSSSPRELDGTNLHSRMGRCETPTEFPSQSERAEHKDSRTPPPHS